MTSAVMFFDPEFEVIIGAGARLERIGNGFIFTEGPVWLKEEQCLLFSDIDGDKIYSWVEGKGVQTWREPSNNANGNTVDRMGRLVTCEHKSRRVTRTEKNGSITVLSKTYMGKKLSSPNDVVVKSDGTIWFSDPPYGIRPEQQEQPRNFVFRLDPEENTITAVAEDFCMPNGLCFSPDEKYLYVTDSDESKRLIRKFTVTGNNALENSEIISVISPGVPDGIRVDGKGNLYCAAGDGVQVFKANGRLIGKILTPEEASNCTFGGLKNNDFFITATSSVWRITVGSAHLKKTTAPRRV